MKKGKGLFLFFVILGLGGWVIFRNPENKKEERNHDSSSVLKAWEFSLSDLSGKRFSLNDFRNRVVLLTFWTSGCPFCIREIPILKEIHNKYSEKDLKIVSVVIGEDREHIKRFKTKEEIPYLILLDEEREVAHLYKVIGVPTDIIIDRQSNIKYYNFFWPKNLKEIIEGLL